MHFIGYVYLGASLRRQLRFSYSRKNRKYDYESHNAPVLKSRKWTKRFVHLHYISLLLVLKLTFLDINSMRQSDISFALTLVLHAMSPPNVKSALSGAQNLKVATEIRTGSLTFTGTRDTKTSAKINTSLYQVSFLGMVR